MLARTPGVFTVWKGRKDHDKTGNWKLEWVRVSEM
jgi:hypothetical protein